MANTRIQVKRATVTTVPPNGSLQLAEPAYSYSSNTFFIGGSDGVGVIPIGGKFYIDQQTAIFGVANAAFGKANTTVTDLTPANNWANTINAAIQTSFAAVNNFVIATEASGNNWANAIGAAANSYAGLTYLKLTSASPQSVSSDVTISGNLTVSGVTTYANATQLLIGDALISLNADLPAAAAPSENAGIEVNRGSSANSYVYWNEATDKWQFGISTSMLNIASNTDVESVAAGANGYAVFIGASSNNWANTVNTAVQTSFAAANNYALSLAVAGNNYANTLNTRVYQTFSDAANLSTGIVPSARISGSYTGITGVGTITVGTWNGNTINVAYGGTGITTAAVNGVLFGAGGAGALQVTAAGTEGQVLQAGATGIPSFGMLDGGTF